MKNWRYWNEFVFRFPLNVELLVRCYANGLKPSELVKANPDLKYGGISFASKYELNNQFNKKYMLAMTLIQKNQSPIKRYKTLDLFLKKENTNYPVALKPDIGHSGKGVTIIKTAKEAKRFLREIQTDYVAQVYCDYPLEFGVFYYKLKGKAEIFSINEKIFPNVTGDGISTVKELMAKDRILQQFINNYNPKELENIPTNNKNYIISKIGNIHQGGVYEDISNLKTPELLAATIEAVKDVKFYYGRFDAKAESREALFSGKFKIIEVNGVHASSSNFFDEKYNYLQAAKIIRDQYKLMIDIAVENQHEKVLTISLLDAWKINKQSEDVLDKHQEVASTYR